ncbi:hypothetical protein P7K49_002742, partial [Saguinus oedipus]
IQAAAKGSSKQVRSLSPPDQPDARKSATHVAGFTHPKSFLQTTSPAGSSGYPNSLHLVPSKGSSGICPKHLLVGRTELGGEERTRKRQIQDHPPEPTWVHEKNKLRGHLVHGQVRGPLAPSVICRPRNDRLHPLGFLIMSGAILGVQNVSAKGLGRFVDSRGEDMRANTLAHTRVTAEEANDNC